MTRLTALLLAVLTISAACNEAPTVLAPAPGQTPPPALPADARAGSSGAGRVAGDRGSYLDPPTAIGTWSFDRTCASEDGMTLNADGTAGNDLGAGWWAVDKENRLVLIIREREMGAKEDPLAERRVFVFTPSEPVGDDFKGRLDGPFPGKEPRAINARRCPSQP